MDIRAAKSDFLDNLVDATILQRQGVSLAIDCLIENEVTGEDKPLVITSYFDSDREFVCSKIEAFCQKIYPKAKSLFNSEVLQVGGSSEIDLSPKFKTMTLMRFPINWSQWRSQNEKALYRRTNHQSYQAA